jgi:hypothetical protein
MKNRAFSFITSGSLSGFAHRHRIAVSTALGSAVFCLSAIALASITYQSSETAASTQVTTTNVTVNKPASLTTGDLMLASVAVHGGISAVVSSVPSGWTLIGSTTNDASVTLLSYWKIAGGSEPGSYQWVINGQTTAEGGITRYTGTDTSYPIDAAAGNTGLGTTATTSAITTTTASDTIVTLFAVDEGKTNTSGSYFGTPTGMTERYDVSNTPFGPSIALDDAIQVTAGSVASKSSTIGGNNKAKNWATEVIALKQAVTVTTNPMTADSNTLALWSMNGSAATVAKEADDGPTGLNLMEVNSPTSGTGWTTPTTDGAYVFDGSSQFLTASDTGFVTGNNARTIEAWVKPEGDTHDNVIFSYGTLATNEWWTLSIGSSAEGDVLHQNVVGFNCDSTSGVPVGSWHHVASTYDGTTVRLYIDGNPAGSCTLSQALNTVLTGTSYIGVDNNVHLEGYFNGDIDQVNFSSGAKSATDIYNYYHGL